LLVPYPSVFTNQRDASTQQNVTLRLNKSHGSSLKSIKHVVFKQDTATVGRYDRSNTAEAKVVSYYTNLNNNRMTEFDILCANQLDYMIQRPRLLDSPALNSAVYKLNWFHEDEFSDNQDKLSDGITDNTNILSGISLNEEIRWDMYMTTASNAHRHFSIVHGQKLMNINARGLVLG